MSLSVEGREQCTLCVFVEHHPDYRQMQSRLKWGQHTKAENIYQLPPVPVIQTTKVYKNPICRGPFGQKINCQPSRTDVFYILYFTFYCTQGTDKVLAREGCRANIPQAHIPRQEHEQEPQSSQSSRCTICCNRCHMQRPWDASHTTGVQWLPGMKGDEEKDLKVNQLNNDGKQRKKKRQKEQKTGSEIWWSAVQSHLAAPPRSVLCSALSVSDEWEMLQGENSESGSWMTRDKTKPRLCSAETPCCISGVLEVREVLDPSGLVSLALFQWRAQSAR